MYNDYIYKEIERHNADGVDFVPIWFEDEKFIPVYASFTKEEWCSQDSCPRTNRKYWALDEHGNKKYLEYIAFEVGE